MARGGNTTWLWGANADTCDAGLRLASRVALVAAVGFAYLAVHELSYWGGHDHNDLALTLAIAGAAGVVLALTVAYGLAQLRRAVYWADTAMWNARGRPE
jgi:hypothetical protein